MEENSRLRLTVKDLSEEAAYAKELASSAAVELKNLAEEITRLSKQNARQAKELVALQHPGRRSGRRLSRGPEESMDSPEVDELRTELLAKRQREAALQAALVEKEEAEEEMRRRYEETRRREMALENELAGMWVVVARLKKGVVGSDLGPDEVRDRVGLVENWGRQAKELVEKDEVRSNHPLKENNGNSNNHHPLEDNKKETVLREIHVADASLKPPPVSNNPELEPLLSRLKVTRPTKLSQLLSFKYRI